VAFGTFTGAASGFGVAPGFGPMVGTTVAPVTTTASLVNGTPAGNLPAALTVAHPETPYVQNFSLQVQQEFYWGTMLSVGYVGALGRHLPYNEELNAALPGAGVAGLPFNAAFGRTASTMYFD